MNVITKAVSAAAVILMLGSVPATAERLPTMSVSPEAVYTLAAAEWSSRKVETTKAWLKRKKVQTSRWMGRQKQKLKRLVD